ncbi:PREDICTED: protein FAM92B-like isoform X2 [Cyprinodon variegatus]|nr:PREDICTED: protein FAM92B-like isoform X2 [Cyprinodon variegatus]
MQAMELVLNNSEKHLGELCSILASYTRKTAKLRDKVDVLVSALFDFSRSEDPEFQVGLNNLAEDLAMVQDYRHAQVERLETRVVSPLKAYGDIFKHKRTELKKFSADLNREQKEVQKLEKLRLRNPADRQRLVSFIQKPFFYIKHDSFHCISIRVKGTTSTTFTMSLSELKERHNSFHCISIRVKGTTSTPFTAFLSELREQHQLLSLPFYPS